MAENPKTLFATTTGQMSNALFAVTATQILERNPKISGKLITNDLQTIKAVLPTVRDHIQKRDLPGAEAPIALSVAWRMLRAPSEPPIELSGQQFIQTSDRLGRLEINSEPIGADVSTDGASMNDQTNTACWLDVGDHFITLTKDGYIPDQGSVTIQEGRNPPYKITLKAH